MSPLRNLLLTVVLSVMAAAAGAWGGARYVVGHMRHPEPLHQLVHEELRLSPDQTQRIEGLERDYDARRSALEAEMRAANADLAQAMGQEHAYTPRVRAAIDRFHMAMGELQKQSILHVLAMRRVLTPTQAAVFDRTVVKALNQESS